MSDDNTSGPVAESEDTELDDLFLDADGDDAESGDELVDVEVLDEEAPVSVESELEQALAQAREELVTANDRLVRKAADLENARRRHQRERDEMTKYAAESVLKEIVPVLDDLERAVEHLTANYEGDASVVQGAEMVARKFKQVLERRGVVAVEGVGKPFDPQFHEAIQQREDTSVPNNTVVQEFQRGYLLHDRLLRPALVVVAQGGPPQPEPAADGAAEDAGLVDSDPSGDDA